MSIEKGHKDDDALEDLLKEKLEDFEVPVDDKDYDRFFAQLEDTGYFEEDSGRRPFYLLWSLALLFVALLSGFLFYFLSDRDKEQKKDALPSVVKQEVPAAQDEPSTRTPSSEEQKETQVQESNKIPKKSFETNIPEPVSHGQKEKSTGEPKETKPVLAEKDSMSVLPEKKKEQVVQKKAPKDSVRVHYVMEVDTIIKVDSQSVNKRKWERLKSKSK